ncbi:WbqC family protein [Methanoculleus sp.]|uniref:WbqC family protein n=1 Tax=Methanoculleus sp. TaxID=90427 RepID=UPI0025FC1C60|nr:WbqC family protein [Methanoculleus sp.]
MKIGIMQPYLFPYLGYFQLIKAVDTFVVFDDVQYIKRGWINRNQIQLNRNPYLFTFGVKKDTMTRPINQRFYAEDTYYAARDDFLKTLSRSYRKAPYFKEVNELVTGILRYGDLNVSRFNVNALRKICDYAKINTPFILSSSLERDRGLRAQEAIIEINTILGSRCYINPIGGRELYSLEEFERNGIALKFIRMHEMTYPQFSGDFIPNLSIIDVLMFSSRDEVEGLLNGYELVSDVEARSGVLRARA